MTHEIFQLTEKQAKKAGATTFPGARYTLHMPIDPTQCSPDVRTYDTTNVCVSVVMIDMPTAFKL